MTNPVGKSEYYKLAPFHADSRALSYCDREQLYAKLPAFIRNVDKRPRDFSSVGNSLAVTWRRVFGASTSYPFMLALGPRQVAVCTTTTELCLPHVR